MEPRKKHLHPKKTKKTLSSSNILEFTHTASISPKTNLFASLSSFVGRIEELHALQSHFSQNSFLTLLGPPGVGKTRLAKEFALQHQEEFSGAEQGGYWFCDLTEVSEFASICAVISRTLTLSLASAENDVSRLGDQLATRGPLLLILDNFEHLVSFANDTIGVWLKRAPEVRFLITSRTALGVPGEVLFDLAPLSISKEEDSEILTCSEAVELFMQRASQVSYHVSKEEMTTVNKLVSRLEGFPFSIELAAARTRILSPLQILTKLEKETLQLHQKGKKTGESRYQTLADAIDFSWNLLSLWEQDVLLQCTVFRGGFSVEAAEAILDASKYSEAPELLDIVQSLCDKSFLFRYRIKEFPKEIRFSLYLSLREHLQKKQNLSQVQKTEKRHKRYFVDAAEIWSQELDNEMPDSQAQSRLSVEFENILHIYERAISSVSENPDNASVAAQTALSLAELLYRQGLWQFAVSLLEKPLLLGEEQKKSSLKGRLLSRLASFQRNLGQIPQSIKNLETAKVIAEEANDQKLLARVLGNLGSSEYLKGNISNARLYIEQALVLHQTFGAHYLEANTRIRLALLEEYTGNISKAKVLFQQTLRTFQELKTTNSESRCLGQLAYFLFLEGSLQESESTLLHALEIAEKTVTRDKIFLLCVLGKTKLEQENLSEAETSFLQALSIAKEIQSKIEEFIINFFYWPFLLLEKGKNEEARQCFEEGLLKAKKMSWAYVQNCALLYLGMLNQQEGRLEEAQTHYETLNLTPLKFIERAKHVMHLGSLYATKGNLDKAEKCFQEAAQKLQILGNPHLLKALTLHRGHVHLAKARHAEQHGENPYPHWKMAYEALRKVSPEGTKVKQTILSQDLRFAVDLLTQALQKPENIFSATSDASSEENELVFSQNERWVLLPGSSEKISLKRRRPLFRIVSHLVQSRLETPGESISWEQILSAGWPGVRLKQETAKNRVYNAITTLRKLGFQDLLLQEKNGYLLDPNLSILQIDQFAEKV